MGAKEDESSFPMTRRWLITRAFLIGTGWVVASFAGGSLLTLPGCEKPGKTKSRSLPPPDTPLAVMLAAGHQLVASAPYDGTTPSGAIGTFVQQVRDPRGGVHAARLFYVQEQAGYYDPGAAVDRFTLPSTWTKIEWQDALGQFPAELLIKR